MLKKYITTLVSATILAVMSSGTSSAVEVNLGGFKGNVSTIVTHGVSIRAEKNDCFLVSGNGNSNTPALLTLIGANPHDGNGGCNFKRQDYRGAIASKVVEVGSVTGDDGRLNFQQGDVIDAGQSIAVSFNGSNAAGIGLTLSGIGFVNPVLDLNDASFKALTNAAKSHIEDDFKLGNAYLSVPVNDSVDLTIGNYVQSQGVTALFPIGVNVVNPVSLPILRSPGAQLKDALLPQAMIGVTAYTPDGVTVEAYMQAEQKEVELDASGSFFGSDIAGVGNSTGVISSALYNEDTSLPLGQVYFDVANCVKDVTGGDIATVRCNSATAEHLWDSDEDSYSIFHDLLDTQFGSGFATSALKTMADGVAGGSLDAYLQATATGGGVGNPWSNIAKHAAGSNSSLTNTEIRDAFTRLYSQYPGRGDMAGLLYIRRGPDAQAKSSGQYGLNLSGYLDDVGEGVEWGLYYNNSHSNTPRIRMLAIQDGYATDMFAFLSAAVTAQGSGGLGQYDLTDDAVTQTEQAVASIAMGGSICGLISATPGAWAGGNGVGGDSTYFFDPANCYATQVAIVGNDSTMRSAAVGALSTLSFVNGGRYQLYYPEDIQTFGVSLSTGINGWASNLEVAYRPDFPLQISGGDLANNLIDSTYGTIVQSTAAFMSAPALEPILGISKWSAMPLCDISSATGKASSSMSGYAVCDGTAEFDVWTVNANFAKSFTASEPFVVAAGADNASLLIDVASVSVPTIDYEQGVVASGQFQSGHDVYQNGCGDANNATAALSAQANGLFGNGYCEDNSGASDHAFSYKLRGALTYNNFNNSKWSFTPSFGFNHDVYGNAPSSIGGFVEGRMSASAGASFSSGGMTSSITYQMELGNELNNSNLDKDYVSANFSYAF